MSLQYDFVSAIPSYPRRHIQSQKRFNDIRLISLCQFLLELVARSSCRCVPIVSPSRRSVLALLPRLICFGGQPRDPCTLLRLDHFDPWTKRNRIFAINPFLSIVTHY
jgi:hypothetical protein